VLYFVETMKKHISNFYETIYRANAGKKHPVLTGKHLATELGYPGRALESIPAELWDDFLPCGNPLPYLDPARGDLLLNLGCGAGVDSLALMLDKSTGFRAVNLDIVFHVLSKTSKTAQAPTPASMPDRVCADAEALPFVRECFKWVILNGVLNLFSDKSRLISEISRVVASGGMVAGADLCRTAPLPAYFMDEPDAWAWCMSGALTEEELTASFASAGFERSAFEPQKLDEFFDRAVFVFEKK